jgi:ribosomal protein L40E
MAWASRLGRARVSAKNPQAAGVCDRCGFIWTHNTMRFQHEWRGIALLNTRMLVCRRCEDEPQQQLRAIILPADPPPIMNARVNTWDEFVPTVRAPSVPPVIDPRTGMPLPVDFSRQAEDGQSRGTQPTGPAGVPTNPAAGRISSSGLERWAIMPGVPGITASGRKLPVLSIMSVGSSVITVTCSAPHGLRFNDQVSVEGLTDNEATGFYSVSPTTATAFTYMTNTPRPMGSLL